ncbi:MAG: ATP-binding protein [bacterium]
MKLQLKFMVLLVAFFMAGFGLLLIQRNFEIQRTQQLLNSELSQRQKFFENIVNLEGSALKQLSNDYSFWDEMVNYVKTTNPDFAKNNLDTSLGTYNVDTYAVYRPDGSIVGENSSKEMKDLRLNKLSPDFFRRLSSNKEAHFYQKTSFGILEVRARDIVPSSDAEHKTKPQGFWVIGRLLQKDYINNISNLSQTNTSLEGSDMNPEATAVGDTIAFSTQLKDWDGSSVGMLKSTAKIPLVNDLKKQYGKQVQLLGGLFVLIAGFTLLAIYFYVLKPIKQISSTIDHQDTTYIEDLRHKKSEFGELAQTVKEFFDQKVVLADAEFRRNELDKLNKEKSSFLAVAAHELNGPVNNVKMFSEYLDFLIKSKKDDQQAIDKQVHRIEHQTVKINMLLNDLRAASTGQSEIVFNIRNFDFDAFIKEEIEEAGFGYKHKLNFTGSTGQTINSDPDRLGQVVSNLIRNAVKYSPDADHVDIRSKFQDGQIIIEIQDYGLGISEEDQKHIFERFFRSSAVTGAFPGLGLGLNISKRIVEGLGGKVWVQSTPGQGSTFLASIPLDSSSIVNPKKPAEETNTLNPEKTNK